MTITSQTGWTTERVAELTRLWALGWSGAQIAKALGDVSKNSVIGKVHRLHLDARRLAYAEPTKSETKTGRKIKRGRTAPKPRPALPPVPWQPRDVPDTAQVPLMLKLMDLTPRSCRWPIGHPGEPGFGFCGHRSLTGRPYCSAHSALSTTGVDRRRDAVIRAMVR